MSGETDRRPVRVATVPEVIDLLRAVFGGSVRCSHYSTEDGGAFVNVRVPQGYRRRDDAGPGQEARRHDER